MTVAVGIPTQLVQAWRLAGLWNGVRPEDQPEISIRPGADEQVIVRAGEHTVALYLDGWMVLCRGSERILEGRMSPAMEREILRVLVVRKVVKRNRREVCVSRLQRRLAAVHVRA